MAVQLNSYIITISKHTLASHNSLKLIIDLYELMHKNSLPDHGIPHFNSFGTLFFGHQSRFTGSGQVSKLDISLCYFPTIYLQHFAMEPARG